MVKRVTVFASSSPRTPTEYLELAAELGRAIARRGWTLVNGAGREGGMGALNAACLEAGGRVHGVILKQFLDQGLAHPGLESLEVAETMRERKRLLTHTSDAFLVLPGGPGTWEEFWEVAVERQIGVHRKPLIVINHRGFYDGFLAQARRAHADGLLYGPVEDLFTLVEDVDAAICRLDG